MSERSKGAEVKSASTSSLLLPSPEEVFQRRRRGGGGKEGRGALLGAKGSSPHPFTLPPSPYLCLPSFPFPFPLFPGDLQSLCSGGALAKKQQEGSLAGKKGWRGIRRTAQQKEEKECMLLCEIKGERKRRN